MCLVLLTTMICVTCSYKCVCKAVPQAYILRAVTRLIWLFDSYGSREVYFFGQFPHSDSRRSIADCRRRDCRWMNDLSNKCISSQSSDRAHFVKDLGGLTSLLRLRGYATIHVQCVGGFKGHLATPTLGIAAIDVRQTVK